MYDPGTALIVFSTLFTAGSALYQGQQAKKQADYNASVAEADAAAAKQKAEYDEKMHRERVRRLLSSQRAAYGKSGVDLAGSPLLMLQDTAKEGELDALAIRYGGDVEASRNRSEANLLRMQGRAARTSGYLQAGGTLLSGGAKAYGRYKYKKGVS